MLSFERETWYNRGIESVPRTARNSRGMSQRNVTPMTEINHTSKQLPLFDTVEIPLTKGYIALVDPIDADLLQYKWNAKTKHAYAARDIWKPKRHAIYLHRVIMERILGRPLVKGETVDHWDLNRMNNTRKNLRLATHSQNGANSRAYSRNKLGVKGVHARRGGFSAHITVNKKHIYLGDYKTIEEAHAAYMEAANKHHGEFARGE